MPQLMPLFWGISIFMFMLIMFLMCLIFSFICINQFKLNNLSESNNNVVWLW